MKNYLTSVVMLGGLVLGGCANLGQEEFTCNSLKKDGVCAGPQDIYEMTNHRENLEGLTLEELETQMTKGEHSNHNHEGGVAHAAQELDGDEEVTVFEKRTLEQHTPYNYQKAEVVPQNRFATAPNTDFGAWPNNGEPMAPEALAIMSEPEPMRILINAYKDDSGALNMPGYVFVDTKPSTFRVGRDAALRPSRIIPLQMKRDSQQNLQRVNQRAQGVDGLGVEAPVGEQ